MKTDLVGRFAVSKAGHDKDTLYIIVATVVVVHPRTARRHTAPTLYRRQIHVPNRMDMILNAGTMAPQPTRQANNLLGRIQAIKRLPRYMLPKAQKRLHT